MRRNAIVYNPATIFAKGFSDDSMLSFLRLLQQRYLSVIQNASAAEAERTGTLRGLVRSLAFAEAYLEKTDLVGKHTEHPLHIAVLGPTQAGKSSVVNWLLDGDLARVSPLAGFTVHPQGFALASPSVEVTDELDRYFHGYRHLTRETLDPEQLDGYVMEWVQTVNPNPVTAGRVVWDTPDFDSIESFDYQNAVLRVAALADVVVLVVSKDKYADLSVWEFMKLLEPLQQPTVIVLNKTDADSSHTLLQSVENKWRIFRPDPPPRSVAIPFLTEAQGLAGLDGIRQKLMADLQAAINAVQRTHYPARARQMLKHQWPAWTAPVIAENRLRQQWNERLELVVKDCVERYQLEYLNHPHHYETFQQAIAEMLTLLEVPGIGSAMTTVRKLVTWPVRQLSKLGKQGSRSGQHLDGSEAMILHRLAEHALIRVSESLLLDSGNDPVEQRWWTHINHQISRQRSDIIHGFDEATRAYGEGLQPEIEKTAHGLYSRLQENPVVLNSLRATRVTTDAAALAAAMYTGGIGLQDLVIAPAMLSVTSLLAESALGHYMNKAAEQLKIRQKSAVEELFRSAIRDRLAPVPDQLDPATRLGISAASLEQATLAVT